MVVESICAGMCTELWGFKALQMQVTMNLVSEGKAHAQKYLKINHTNGTVPIKHMFATMDEHCTGEGSCLTCGRRCIVAPGCDIGIGGLLCQPFSKQRYTGGSTSKTRRAEQHSGYEDMFDNFAKFLDERQPASFLVEEVLTFATLDEGLHMKRLMNLAGERGYAVRAMTTDARVWHQWPRGRVFLMGFTSACGGGKAAAIVTEYAKELACSFQFRVSDCTTEVRR
jgi:site-specific DNA-cytosine methylase